MSILLLRILRLAIGVLAPMAIDFLEALINERANNKILIDEALSIVRSIERRPGGMKGSAKAHVARANLRNRLPAITVDMKDSTLNGIIEMAVQVIDKEMRKARQYHE